MMLYICAMSAKHALKVSASNTTDAVTKKKAYRTESNQHHQIHKYEDRTKGAISNYSQLHLIGQY